jgi:hypothetical protein
MCPVCFSSVAWLITGGLSMLGASAGGVAVVRDGKIATRSSKTNVAPRGSPWTRARAAAVISEFHRNAATLVTLAIR